MIAKIVAVDGAFKIESPNDWLQKAGAYVNDAKEVVLPHQFLLTPMRIASKAVVAFQENNKYENRVESAFLISLCVRNAEDSFFRKVAELINSRRKIQICKNCIWNCLFDTDLKKFRNLCNEKIIHALEKVQMINPADLNYAVQYYDEFFKLPLMPSVALAVKKDIPLCKKCLEVRKENIAARSSHAVPAQTV